MRDWVRDWVWDWTRTMPLIAGGPLRVSGSFKCNRVSVAFKCGPPPLQRGSGGAGRPGPRFRPPPQIACPR